jgi:hypothetical protein
MKKSDQTRERKKRGRAVPGSRSTMPKCNLFLVGQAKSWHRWTNRSASLRRCVLQSDEDITRCFAESPKDSIWVAKGTSRFAALAKASAQGSSDRRLLVLSAIDEITHHVLTAWFRYVVVGIDSISLLEPEALLEVLQAPNRDELFIGGAFDRNGKVIVLYRGSVEPLIVPLEWFRNTGDVDRPIPGKLEIVDFGQTVKFGDFEAAADAILYDFDSAYRTRAKKRFIETDTSLGGAIRRLRLQRGLCRGDFAPVPVRTIARIESGEVSQPQRSTLEKIADRLGVSVESLGSY